ncbi:hypothetical protein JZ751_004737 [Albula glossodonta]|uniref:Ig-like domain-containing protein n=1 Tax=Albula glossodonta TaxID=121402 RepID=A0A8T2N4S5_9TELE|nr:hypothetical protein JZ751_004737 [Albula glossodonta]
MYSMGILTAFGISFQKKTNLLYVLNGCINILAIATMSASQLVAAPGSDITLGCSFPHRDTDNIQNLIVNWQRGTTEVVHSYYHGKDQLDRQSLAYTGRTQLNPDELKKGNASLSLVGVQASDHGEYTCAVSNEQGSFRGNIFLKVAACCVNSTTVPDPWIRWNLLLQLALQVLSVL